MIYLNLAAPGFRKIKKKRKQNIINRLDPVYTRVQGGRELASNLAKAGLELISKAIGSDFGKRLINKGLITYQTYSDLEFQKYKIKMLKEQ